ncbi:MAG TPA: PfkB family carbohydrate kinase [Terriglobales bacterium]|nr:PfkB family carbohydrate kinase [Terriglobales bacterium]
MNPPTILGLGSACWDTLLEVHTLPGPGGKSELLSERGLPGGQVASVLVGCCRLGLAASMLLRTGDDPAGAHVRAALAAAGVDLTHGRIIAAAATATAYIVRDRAGERAVIWRAPEAMAVASADVTPAMLDGVDALFFDGRDGGACLRLAQWARARSIPVIADLDCVYPHTAALLPWIDHLVSPAEFTLAAAAPCPTVVITRGHDGAEGHEHGGERLHVPAFPAAVVDTTGAGDAFHAGYIFALLQGWPLPARLRFANATAACACAAVGAQAGLPTLRQVEARLADEPQSRRSHQAAPAPRRSEATGSPPRREHQAAPAQRRSGATGPPPRREHKRAGGAREPAPNQ